ncbi:related to tRNA-specific adenosine deaminase 1 [Saccharomycodes ludwigii]|uniref:Related to tRNA-specific adenosine deaminase 1 n=1 Tax=Saccharomycodes ludwigii TaxID=36035 RepID=A0A376B4X1_9ASCO|nr:related to tRNA-specific adenosine deaminase 1 [Saccharomycodes ludwigii]
MDPDCIAETVYTCYKNNLDKNLKPCIRSNGIKEWTVLAGIVAYDSASDAYIPVSIATGVKATANSQLQRSNGRILHDCHAEILALRGFNTVLLMQINNKNGYLLEPTEQVEPGAKLYRKFRIKDTLKFALYISQLPCGDCSMEEEGANTETIDIIRDFTDDNVLQYVNADIKTILRGRFNYKKKNVVRTKPGRADSKITYSKSCSDKLCLKQVLSICNALTYFYLESPVYLDSIIVPNLTPRNVQELKRSFRRLSSIDTFHPIDFESTTKCFINRKMKSDEEASLMCSCVLNIDNNQCFIQDGILNGVRNGYYTRGKRPLRKNCESILSRYHQWQKLFNDHETKETYKSYLSFKLSLNKRCVLRNEARKILSSDGWIETFMDDC